MENTAAASPLERPVEPQPAPVAPSKQRKGGNEIRYREEWLQAAISRLRDMFNKAGSPIPDFGRAAIGFTSRGGKGTCVGECWASAASGDGHFEIFIRPDKADPVEVLGILCHELVHSAVPNGSGHGLIFKGLAQKIGLEGKMRHAMPGMHLTEVLKELAAELGPFPHASLDIEHREQGRRKKQKTNLLKAFCEGVQVGEKYETCDFTCRLTTIHAKKGAPYCGIHNVRMVVEWPSEDEGGDGENPDESEAVDAASPSPVNPSSPPDLPVKPPRAASPPAPEYRPVGEGEVFEPGGHYKMDQETGITEVLIVPPASPNHGETNGV